jgi:hypothetical protein
LLTLGCSENLQSTVHNSIQVSVRQDGEFLILESTSPELNQMSLFGKRPLYSWMGESFLIIDGEMSSLGNGVTLSRKAESHMKIRIPNSVRNKAQFIVQFKYAYIVCKDRYAKQEVFRGEKLSDPITITPAVINQ